MVLRLRAIATDATRVGTLVQGDFDQPSVVIGRSDQADLVLADPSVGLLQARIVRDEDGWTIEDLAEGRTRLVGRRLWPGHPVPVRPGQPIELGVYALVCDEVDPAQPEPTERELARHLAARLGGAERATDEPAWPDPALVVVNGPGAGRRLALPEGARVQLGRGRGCDLVLDDRRVSRIHAWVHHRAGTIWVEDAGSANGIALDGRAVRQAASWGPGARLAIGRFELVLRFEDPAVLGWSAVLRLPHARPRAGQRPAPAWLLWAGLTGLGGLLGSLLLGLS